MHRTCPRLLLPLLLLVALTVGPRIAAAEAPWEKQVNAARLKQDGEIQQAKRSGAMARVVNTAKARLARQRNVLNIYLVARALYYHAKYEQSQAGQLLRDKKKAQAQEKINRARAIAEDAIQYLRECLTVEPRFWFARKSLAQLYLETTQLDAAVAELKRVLPVKPHDPDVVKLAIATHGARKEWAEVERYARRFLQSQPQEMSVRMALIQCLADQGKLSDAAREMEVVVRANADDPQLRMSYAMLLYKLAFQGKDESGTPDAAPLRKAANQVERIVRTRPNSFELWGTLTELYFYLKDKQNLERALEQMIRLAPNAETKQRMEKSLAQLRRGQAMGPLPQKGGPAMRTKDPVALLIEAALDETNVQRRRDALQQYYDAGIPYVPLVLYARISAKLEPDAACRRLIVRILGRLGAVEAIKHVARAVWDADASVRVVAADELGKYTHAGILLYLEPMLFNVRLDPLPTTPEARRALGLEYNTVRNALHNHTRFRDRELMAEGPIPLEKLQANRERWKQFFRSERGRLAFLDALEAFPELNDPYPERYLLIRAAEEEEHMEVRRRAYEVLRANGEKVKQGDDPVMKKRWAGFPVFEPSSLTKETSAEKRRLLLAWYQSTRK